jgi:translation initiation factor IF-3
MKTIEALARARELEMDLVEINPKAEPPVCKIIEFTHFKYQKEKEARKQKANAHESEIKGIRLSVRIGEHDLDVRLTQSLTFLERGDKVKPEIILRGRENARPELAFETIREFQKLLNEKMEIRVEQEPSKQANKVTAIFAKK